VLEELLGLEADERTLASARALASQVWTEMASDDDFTALELDPDGVVVPSMVGGFTDGRMFSRLGIQNYGFLPMKLPPGTNFSATVHAADERVPVEALEFGLQAMSAVIERYGQDGAA